VNRWHAQLAWPPLYGTRDVFSDGRALGARQKGQLGAEVRGAGVSPAWGKWQREERQRVRYGSNTWPWADVKLLKAGPERGPSPWWEELLPEHHAGEDGHSKRGRQGETMSEKGNAINRPAHAALRRAPAL